MTNFKKFFLLVALFTLGACQTALHRYPANFEIPQSVEQLVWWETNANAVAQRSEKMIEIFHYEIPLRLLENDYDKFIDSGLIDSLLFEKNGEKYVRWMINPEDTKWHLEVQSFLNKHNIDSKPQKFFHGYKTASRSMILVNPENGASFSLKVSTNNTGGNWVDKKQTWDDAKQIREMDKAVSEIMSEVKTETLVLQHEPMAFGIKEIDQGMIMRSLNDLPQNGHYYIPGFSVLHEEEGAQIAKLNKATNIAEFWDKHYNRPLAKASAEFFAHTGISYDSPHSQNFLVELDKDMKPTGRIVLRDFGDSYLLEGFFKQTKYAHLLNIWEEGNVLKQAHISVGLLHGNKAPSWMSKKNYERYAINYFHEFEKKYSEITAIPADYLSKTALSGHTFSYYQKSYNTNNENWKKLFEYANCLNGGLVTMSGKKCLDIYSKFRQNVSCSQEMSAFINQ